MNAAALRLYRHPLSGHCHRVELLLSLLQVPFEKIDVNLARAEHRTPAFLARNSFGQLPVLEAGELTLSDSNAILVYLAERFDAQARYYPRELEARVAIQRWFSVAAGQVAYGPAAARRLKVFGAKLDYEEALATTARLFDVLESELQAHPFLVGESVTLADVSVYAYVAHAPEGGISLEPRPHIRAWLARVEALPGFVPMQRAGG